MSMTRLLAQMAKDYPDMTLDKFKSYVENRRKTYNHWESLCRADIKRPDEITFRPDVNEAIKERGLNMQYATPEEVLECVVGYEIGSPTWVHYFMCWAEDAGYEIREKYKLEDE